MDSLLEISKTAILFPLLPISIVFFILSEFPDRHKDVLSQLSYQSALIAARKDEDEDERLARLKKASRSIYFQLEFPLPLPLPRREAINDYV